MHQLTIPPVAVQARTDTVNISLDGVCHLVVDNETDILHVDTTSGKICSHEKVGIACPKGLQSCFSLLLGFSRVQGRSVPLIEQNELRLLRRQ